MTSREVPRCIRQQISVQQIGTETLVYDERQHRAFCLNQSSAVVWRLANGEHTVEQIREAASVELKAAVSEELVLFALAELRRDGLVEASAMDDVGRSISRRKMLQKLGVGGAMLLPAIASIMAPTAAQAYSGCFDCSSSSSAQAARVRRIQQAGGSKSASAPAGSPQK